MVPWGRQWLAERVYGEVLEVAIGTGRNLEHYPQHVCVTGVELSPAVLGLARRRAAKLGREVALHEGNAQALPYDNDSFDTVVCALSLCAIPGPATAIGQMWRVLRPGGRLLLLDHVASTWWSIRVGQGLLERLTIRPRVSTSPAGNSRSSSPPASPARSRSGSWPAQ